LTVTDAANCVTTAGAFVVSQPAAVLNVTNVVVQNPGCFGSNGNVTITVSGGTAPYTFLWSSGQTTQNLVNVAPGTYSVVVTDAKGCSVTRANIVVAQPAGSVSVNLASLQNVSCFNQANGAIAITVSGGTAPFTFVWSSGQTTQNISGLTAEVFSVTATDANGCKSSLTSFTVSQPAAALSVSPTVTNVACFGDLTGSVALAVSGGTPPYSFLWSTGALTQNLVNVPSGSYNVTVTDAKGCVQSVNNIAVGQPTLALNAVATSTPTSCTAGSSTGTASVTATGGTLPYSYLWNTGATSVTITNLPAGFYNNTVTDAKGCVFRSSTAVSQASSIVISGGVTQNVNCFGGSNGAISISVSGGVTPYTYVWNPPQPPGATVLTGLSAGFYTVTVTDANVVQCEQIRVFQVTQPASALSASIGVVTNVNCFGTATGGVTVNVAGGVAPYTFLWSNGATTQNIQNVVAGTYTVQVKDANGCGPITLSATVTQPASGLSASIGVVTNVNCFGTATGGVTVNVAGGVAPYTFLWSNGATTQNIQNVVAGTYTVQVRDASSCGPITLSATVTQPASGLSVAIVAVTSSQCPGNTGSVSTSVTGGTTPYTFLWSNGATTQNLNGVGAGPYSLQVTDARGCSTNSAVATVGCAGNLQITCPNNVNTLCPANFNPSITGFPTVVGCATASPAVFTDGPIVSACGNTGTITRTWSVSGCGQQVSCQQALSTFDNVKPQIGPIVSGGLNNVTVTCLSDVTNVPVPSVVATDNCQNSNTLLPCNCCNLCKKTDLFPCCNCERPKT
jgi:hypothetical protein